MAINKSFITVGSVQLQTILSSRGTVKYALPKPWPKDTNSLLQAAEAILSKYGSKIVAWEIQRRLRSHRYIEILCGNCSRTGFTNLDSILVGRSTGCTCRRIRVPSIIHPCANMLRDRYYAIVQRCNNPDCEEYRNYGARGIRTEFKDATEFVSYILANLPHATYKDLDIDRQDNDGNYAPGNLRLVPRALNLRNKRTNKWVKYRGKRIIATDLYTHLKRDYPGFKLSQARTTKLALQGIPWVQILVRKARGPYQSTLRSTTS